MQLRVRFFTIHLPILLPNKSQHLPFAFKEEESFIFHIGYIILPSSYFFSMDPLCPMKLFFLLNRCAHLKTSSGVPHPKDNTAHFSKL